MSEPLSADIFHRDGRLRLELFTRHADWALEAAVKVAQETRWESLRSPHIFMGLLAEPDAGLEQWALQAGLNLKAMLDQFKEAFSEPSGSPCRLALHREFLSDNVIRVLRDAHERAQARGRLPVTPLDLLITVLTTPDNVVTEYLNQTGTRVEKLVEIAKKLADGAA
jgi:ATP-dependent Clp protease ATP-binding subunit ClpA